MVIHCEFLDRQQWLLIPRHAPPIKPIIERLIFRGRARRRTSPIHQLYVCIRRALPSSRDRKGSGLAMQHQDLAMVICPRSITFIIHSIALFPQQELIFSPNMLMKKNIQFSGIRPRRWAKCRVSVSIDSRRSIYRGEREHAVICDHRAHLGQIESSMRQAQTHRYLLISLTSLQSPISNPIVWPPDGISEAVQHQGSSRPVLRIIAFYAGSSRLTWRPLPDLMHSERYRTAIDIQTVTHRSQPMVSSLVAKGPA